jgi:hypothetical protein
MIGYLIVLVNPADIDAVAADLSLNWPESIYSRRTNRFVVDTDDQSISERFADDDRILSYVKIEVRNGR